MSDIESTNWSETAASNNAAPPNGMPEGQAPSTVNDGVREYMGAIKREWNRSHPTLASAGTANAQTLTNTVAVAALVQGQVYTFAAGATNTGAMTLAVDGLTAKAVQLNGSALTGGEIVSGKLVTVGYYGGAYEILSLPGHYRGGLIGIQTFGTAGSFTYTPTVGTNSVVVELVGAGAGGGGCALTIAAQVAMGGAGAGGGFATKRIIASFSGVTVTVGAKGTGGTAGANAGTAGGSTSFGALLSAAGGNLGGAGPAQGSPSIAFGAQGAAGSSGAPNGSGGAGGPSFSVSSTAVAGGAGGLSFYGAGAPGANTVTGSAGNNAITPGSGGSGGNNTASQGSARAGGDGADGFVRVWEFG